MKDIMIGTGTGALIWYLVAMLIGDPMGVAVFSSICAFVIGTTLMMILTYR